MDSIQLFIIEDNPPILKALFPNTEIKVHTVFEDENIVLKTILAGSSKYQLNDAVIQPSVVQKLVKHFSLPKMSNLKERRDSDKKTSKTQSSLTVREIECLQIIAKGLSNQEAAAVLRLSSATIRTHLEHIYQKLDVSNRVEAITEGIRQGIVDL